MSCLDKKCTECPEHAVADGKIVCNKENRLKLKPSPLENMLFGGKK